MRLLSFGAMWIFYVKDSLAAIKASAAQQETEAARSVPGAPFLAFSLGRSCFCQNVRSSAVPLGGTFFRQESQYSPSSKPGLSDSCSQIAAVGLREAHHLRRRKEHISQSLIRRAWLTGPDRR